MKNTKKPANSFTIFDWLKEVSYNKSPWDSFSNEQKKSFEPYMINRFLSMNKEYIELINYIQITPPFAHVERGQQDRTPWAKVMRALKGRKNYTRKSGLGHLNVRKTRRQLKN